MFVFSGCDTNEVNTSSKTALGITKYPPAADYSSIGDKIINTKKFPSYDPNSLIGWQVDIRSTDLTSFDLSNRGYDLLNSCFDSKTKWPKKLPAEFDPEKVLNDNKNPGLNINKLHKEGITGKGVNIAIIDYALLVDHKEFGDRVKM
jgi:subtilisin family serine protease